MATELDLPVRRPGGPIVAGVVVVALTAPALHLLWQRALSSSTDLEAPATASILTLGLFGLGVSLVCHAHPGRLRTLLGNSAALAAAALGLATLADAAFADTVATHAWLDPRFQSPGLVAVGLVAIGTSLGAGSHSLASIRAGLVGIGAGALIVLGGAYDLDQAAGPAAAWGTIPGITTLIAALGAMLRHDELGLVAALRARDEVGAALRRSLVAAVVVPSVFGQLALAGNRAGLYGDATGTALLAAVSMTALVVVAFIANRGVRRANAARSASDAALAASEARYRRIFDRASVGIAQLSGEGRWLRVNDRLCEMLGRTPDALRGTTWAEVSDVSDLPLDAEMWERLQSGEIEDFAMERRFVRTDGTIVHADVRLARENELADVSGAAAMRFIAVLQDITERNALEDQLRVYERAVSATQSGVVITDARKPDHPIVSVNASFERITGYAAAEVLGRNCRFLSAGARGQAGLDTLRRAIDAGESCAVMLRNFRANGAGFWNSVSVAPVHDADGRVTHFVGAMLDSTEQVQLIAEREALLQTADEGRSAAEQANAAKDRFLSVVSHELRSPMNAVIGWASLLRDEPDDEKRSHGFDAIDASMRAQNRLVDDLLDTSRIRSGGLGVECARIDLARAVAVAFEHHVQTARAKQIELALQLPLGAAICHADNQRVEQILDNLIDNALKFTPRGGRVEVELREADGQWEILVRDSGRGLSADALEHVFDEFWQVDPRGGRGLGLGLAIVKHLVERQGGQVSVESPGPGLGATFRVRLPRSSEADVGARPAPRALHPARPAVHPLAGAVVVVVDDDPPTALAFAAALERVGAVVRVAHSVADALEFVAESPAALVSDIGMPERSGLDLIREVRSAPDSGHELLAIAVTARAGPEDRRRILRSGFDACLAKPVKAEEVVERLAGLRSRLLREKPPMRKLIILDDERVRAAGTLESLRADGHVVVLVSDARSALAEAGRGRADAILIAEPAVDPEVGCLAKRLASMAERPALIGMIESDVEPISTLSEFVLPLREPRALQRFLRLMEDFRP